MSITGALTFLRSGARMAAGVRARGGRYSGSRRRRSGRQYRNTRTEPIARAKFPTEAWTSGERGPNMIRTLNLNSWSPDSSRFTFVDYPIR